MIVARSLLFNLVFYVTLFVYFLVAMPTLVLPRRAIVKVATHWGRTNLVLLRLICGIRWEVRGAERIPRGPLLVAAKHQSMWETFALLRFFDDPAFILKRELLWIPFFGWYAWKAGSVPVDRGGGSRALKALAARSAEALRHGAQIIIFPEGTRRAPGAPPNYRYGVAQIYADTGASCLPVALNSGLFWPRRSFVRYPGTIVVEFLQPIPPHLDKQAFLQKLEDDTESATARLVAEGRTEWRGGALTRTGDNRSADHGR